MNFKNASVSLFVEHASSHGVALKSHPNNLIKSPRHVDFTPEVTSPSSHRRSRCRVDNTFGCSGRTGATWEIGLTETPLTLVWNSMRDHGTLETDGQLRTLVAASSLRRLGRRFLG